MEQPGEIVAVKLWIVNERLANPAARLNPSAWLTEFGLELETDELRHRSSVMNVILIQESKIGITASVELLMQPGGTGLLGTHPQQEPHSRNTPASPAAGWERSVIRSVITVSPAVAAEDSPIAPCLEDPFGQFTDSAVAAPMEKHCIGISPHRRAGIQWGHQQVHLMAYSQVIQIVANKSSGCLTDAKLFLKSQQGCGLVLDAH